MLPVICTYAQSSTSFLQAALDAPAPGTDHTPVPSGQLAAPCPALSLILAADKNNESAVATCASLCYAWLCFKFNTIIHWMNKKFIAPLAVATGLGLLALLWFMADVAGRSGFVRLDPKEGWLFVGQGWLAIAGYAGVFLGVGTAIGAVLGYVLGGQFWRWQQADLDAQLAEKQEELVKGLKLVQQGLARVAQRDAEAANVIAAAVADAQREAWQRVEAAEAARRGALQQVGQMQQRLANAQAKAGRLKDQLKQYKQHN